MPYIGVADGTPIPVQWGHAVGDAGIELPNSSALGRSSCLWASASQLRILLAYDATVGVADDIGVADGKMCAPAAADGCIRRIRLVANAEPPPVPEPLIKQVTPRQKKTLFCRVLQQ